MAKPALLRANEEGKIQIFCPKCEGLITEKNQIVEHGLTGKSRETMFYYDRQCECGLKVRYYLDSYLKNISNRLKK